MAQVPFAVPVPLGHFSLVVTGNFGSSFVVASAVPSAPGGWATTVTVTTQATNTFTCNFNVGAPPGAEVTFLVFGVLVGTAGEITLADYLSDVRRLLKDQRSQTYTDVDLTAWINRAIKQRDLDTGMNRAVILMNMTLNQAIYPIEGILSGGTVLMGPIAPQIVDVASIHVIVLGAPPGGIRYPLGRWPYSKSAFIKTASYPGYPVKYSVYGAENIVVVPPPAQSYATEWDFYCYTPDLVALTDADPLPYPWTDPVPFLAASFAKAGAQRFDEAREFNSPDLQKPGLYQQRINFVRAQARRSGIPNPYFDLPRGVR